MTKKSRLLTLKFVQCQCSVKVIYSLCVLEWRNKALSGGKVSIFTSPTCWQYQLNCNFVIYVIIPYRFLGFIGLCIFIVDFVRELPRFQSIPPTFIGEGSIENGHQILPDGSFISSAYLQLYLLYCREMRQRVKGLLMGCQHVNHLAAHFVFDLNQYYIWSMPLSLMSFSVGNKILSDYIVNTMKCPILKVRQPSKVTAEWQTFGASDLIVGQ